MDNFSILNDIIDFDTDTCDNTSINNKTYNNIFFDVNDDGEFKFFEDMENAKNQIFNIDINTTKDEIEIDFFMFYVRLININNRSDPLLINQINYFKPYFFFFNKYNKNYICIYLQNYFRSQLIGNYRDKILLKCKSVRDFLIFFTETIDWYIIKNNMTIIDYMLHIGVNKNIIMDIIHTVCTKNELDFLFTRSTIFNK